jgi:hypothetical protein
LVSGKHPVTKYRREYNIKSIYSITLFLLIVGCSQQPDIDIAKVAVDTEDYFRELEEIDLLEILQP